MGSAVQAGLRFETRDESRVVLRDMIMKMMGGEVPVRREPLVVAQLALVLGPPGVVRWRMFYYAVYFELSGCFEDLRAIRALMVADVAVFVSLMIFQAARLFALVSAFGPVLVDMIAYVVIYFVVHEVDVLLELVRVAPRLVASIDLAFALPFCELLLLRTTTAFRLLLSRSDNCGIVVHAHRLCFGLRCGDMRCAIDFV
jgi:hypothetical protein